MQLPMGSGQHRRFLDKKCNAFFTVIILNKYILNHSYLFKYVITEICYVISTSFPRRQRIVFRISVTTPLSYESIEVSVPSLNRPLSPRHYEPPS